MPLVKVFDAPTVYRHLNGVINVFKPAGMKVKHVRVAILHKICTDLNQLKMPELSKPEVPALETGSAADPVLRKMQALFQEDLFPKPQYQMSDLKCTVAASLGFHTSGVLLMGINRGVRDAMRIQMNRPIRVYHITGLLGTATENHLPDSLITVRANYRHVHAERISALAASMQASHQRKMYELCGVDLQSQAAYEIACKGLIRPADNSLPVIYGIKLIDFKRPEFTLEVHAANESERYLAALVHEMGIELRTVAHCKAIRCIRHGHFTLEDSLLRHGWNLAGIVKNMRIQKEVLEKHPYLLAQDKVELHSSTSS